MARPRSPRALASRGAFALPFVTAAIGLRLAVAPTADAIATALTTALHDTKSPACASGETLARPSGEATPAPTSPSDGPREDGDALVVGEVHKGRSRMGPARVASRGRTEPGSQLPSANEIASARILPSPGEAPAATFVVPASAVVRALEKRDVGASNAIGRDGTSFGARLAGVSRYHTGLREGDVVVSVAGTRTPTVAAMVSAAMAAAGGGATRLTGRIARGDAIYAVVLELPTR